MPQSEPKIKLVKSAKKIFSDNTIKGFSTWKNTEFKFIAPSDKEYIFQWLWDTAFHAIVLSHFDTKWAKEEVLNFLKGQGDDGFLPHIIFWGNKKRLPHWAYIESAISIRPRTSSITQPPVFGIAVEQIYKKDKDKEFLGQTVDRIARHHKWLIENRDNDNDGLISIISPNESGMDELPVFQIAANYSGQQTTRLHYTYRKGDLKNYRYKFDSKKILEKDYFNVEELLFNTVYIESTRSISRLYKELNRVKDSEEFRKIAEKAEKSLIDKCWDSKDEIFYSIYSNKEKIARVKTASSLVPLFLDGLKGEKLEKLIKKHVLNENEFWTPYPFPSVAKDEPYYYPNETPLYKIKLLWRGPTWISTNWLIVKGLRKHGYNSIADGVVIRMLEMIEKEGFREYYNPETGKGYRRENFGWSTLIIDLL